MKTPNLLLTYPQTGLLINIFIKRLIISTEIANFGKIIK
jgi:hypothetical protein